MVKGNEGGEFQGSECGVLFDDFLSRIERCGMYVVYILVRCVWPEPVGGYSADM